MLAPLCYGVLMLSIFTRCSAQEEILANDTIDEIWYERDIFGNAVDKSEFCKGAICIRKCCDAGYLLNLTSTNANGFACIEDSIQRELNPKIYTKDLKLTAKKAKDLFKLLNGQNIRKEGFYMDPYMNLYLDEGGIMQVESPNSYEKRKLLENDNFCVDTIQTYDTRELIVSGLIIYPAEDEPTQDPVLTISGTFISSVFLLATLAVYVFLPQLRNLHGKVLMAYVASMLVGFLTMGTIQLMGYLDNSSAWACHLLSLLCYFSLLATFFWLNVMSFDIWWTFRGMANARDINRRGENHKFLMYCLYGFGCPLGMTVIFCFLNYLPMDQINQAVITPGITSKGCFVSGVERFLYLYIPMTILIFANCVLFLATMCNLCAVQRATRHLRSADSAMHRASQHRFILYVKVFLVMGLSWILEVVSSFTPDLIVWKFTDAWNLMVGVIIFFIFVCKKKTFHDIHTRFCALRGIPSRDGSRRHASRSASASTTVSSLDQDAFPAELVSLNPKGTY